MNFFSNKYLLGATSIVISLQMLAVYTPFLQRILHTVPLTLSEWMMIVVIATSIIWVEEIRKFFYRSRKVVMPQFSVT
jgi:Ca2+-transporting ATPase